MIKNLKVTLVNANYYTLPESIVRDYNLCSCNVSVGLIKAFAEFEETCTLFEIGFKHSVLNPCTISLRKMKVSNALSLFSNAVAFGLHYLVKEEGHCMYRRCQPCLVY